MRETSIYLYIFSGPHLGTKIALSEGVYIIGSDERADIVLSSQNSSQDFQIAPRHAALTISKEGLKEQFITVEALDGSVYKDFNSQEDSFTITNGEAFYLSSTCFAWNFPGVQQESILPQIIKTTLLQEDEVIQDENTTNVVDTSSEVFSETSLADDNNDNSVVIEEKVKSGKSIFYKILLFLLLGILLLSLSVYYEPRNDNISLEISDLITQLAKNKIDNVEVYQQNINGKESILVEGFIKSEAERKIIQDLARTLHYHVYLSLEVLEDITNAVQNSFMLLGIFPYLEIKDSVMDVSAYIKDALIEEAAFITVQNEVPDLPQIKRNIIYQNELSLLIEAQFIKNGINNAFVTYSDGSISIAGKFSAETIKKINQSMNSIMDEIHIPLTYTFEDKLNKKLPQVLAQNEKQQPVLEEKKTPSHEPNSTPEKSELTLGGLDIMSINTDAIPFITTNDGQRLFTGALLPNGFAIESIHSDKIILGRGSQKITIDLQ